MFRTHLLITLRTLKKQFLYSMVNILGLSVGIAACLLISLWVIHEWSYDRYHTHYDSIYRVIGGFKLNESEFTGTLVSPSLKKVLEEDFPEIEQVARLRPITDRLFHKEGQTSISVEKTTYSDSELFQIFDIPFVEGSAEKSLLNPNSVVLSKSTAETFFPGEKALGKILLNSDDKPFTITGVYEDLPDNNHFQVDLFISMENLQWAKEVDWFSFNFLTYIKVKDGYHIDFESFNKKLASVAKLYFTPIVKNDLQLSWEEFTEAGNYFDFSLQSLKDIHLRSHLAGELAENGSITYVYLFSFIAFMTLLIACFNYTNLTTARSSHRAKEVGIKKVLGAGRPLLIKQFLLETSILTFLAFMIALIFAELSLPLFNQLAQKNLTIPYDIPLFWICWLMGIGMVTLIAGSYPSLFLSGFQPMIALKSSWTQGHKRAFFRGGLVIFQFSVSLILLISTLLIYGQIQFMRHKDLGFDPTQLLILHDTYTLGDKVYPLRDEIRNLPEVLSTTVSSDLPINGIQHNSSFWPKGAQDETHSQSIILEYWRVDHEYVPTFGLEIIEGRNFRKDYAPDTAAIILNESAVRAYGFVHPVGEILEGYNYNTGNRQIYEIIGVMKNTHFQSFEYKVGPMALTNTPTIGRITLKLNTEEYANLIPKIERLWKEFAPSQPLFYQFMDERFAQFYQSEKRLGKILLTFTLIAIFIASLGLLALAAYMVERRAKEVSIRKVLGATIQQIILLLSKDFTLFVSIAWLIAVPIAILGVHEWLQQYNYRISMWETAPLIIMLTGLGGLLIPLMIICFQALETAKKDPVTFLREE